VGIEIKERSPGHRLYDAMRDAAASLSWRERMDLWSAWRNGWEWEEVSIEVRAKFETTAKVSR
jgi:hypothetical protein